MPTKLRCLTELDRCAPRAWSYVICASSWDLAPLAFYYRGLSKKKIKDCSKHKLKIFFYFLLPTTWKVNIFSSRSILCIFLQRQHLTRKHTGKFNGKYSKLETNLGLVCTPHWWTRLCLREIKSRQDGEWHSNKDTRPHNEHGQLGE